MPVAISSDRHRSWPEHSDAVVADLPVWEVATADRSPVRLWVTFADPADDPPPGVCVDVTEGPFGHPVAESGRELARLQVTDKLGPDQAIVVAFSSTPTWRSLIAG